MINKKRLNDMTRNDCFNNKIKRGDQVMYMKAGKWHRLIRGKIVGFTLEMVKIAAFNERDKRYCDVAVNRYPDLVAKITEIK